MKVVAIIQARMGSTRLPGKVMMDIADKPMLQHVIERVSRAKLVDEVVVAYPCNQTEKPIEQLVFYRRDSTTYTDPKCEENDLVGRYYWAAKFYNADLIVRVCADNPCIEPGEIDRLIQFEKDGIGPALGRNYAPPQHLIYNASSHPRWSFGYPDGIGAELYTIEQLEWMANEISYLPDKEHPHKYFFRYNLVYGPQCPPEFARPDLRLDVNTQADLDYIRDIYAQFPDNTFHIVDVIKYLNAKDVGMAV